MRKLYNLIILGIILSILYYEFTEISPGGIVVPGYIALYINQPERILSTIIISLFTLFIVNFLSKYIILYGKRKFGIMIIISFVIKLIFINIFGLLSISSTLVISSIGFIIPGIIAQDIGRQGIFKTVSSMLIVASLTQLINILLTSGVFI